MGVGKTAIGSKLAVRLGYHFMDSDSQIEKNTPMYNIRNIHTQGRKLF